MQSGPWPLQHASREVFSIYHTRRKIGSEAGMGGTETVPRAAPADVLSHKAS